MGLLTNEVDSDEFADYQLSRLEENENSYNCLDYDCVTNYLSPEKSVAVLNEIAIALVTIETDVKALSVFGMLVGFAESVFGARIDLNYFITSNLKVKRRNLKEVDTSKTTYNV